MSRRNYLLILFVSVLLGTAGVAAAQQKLALPGRYQFTVQIEGLTTETFREVSGVGIDIEVTEMREGGSNTVHKLPGLVKFPNVTLKRAFTGSTNLYDWTLSYLAGKGVRRTVTITVKDMKGTTMATFTLTRAFPVKWVPPALNASGNDVPIETLEIAHEGVTMTGGPK